MHCVLMMRADALRMNWKGEFLESGSNLINRGMRHVGLTHGSRLQRLESQVTVHIDQQLLPAPNVQQHDIG